MSKQKSELVVSDLDTALRVALTLARRQLMAQRCEATQIVVAKIQAAISHNGLVPESAPEPEAEPPE